MKKLYILIILSSLFGFQSLMSQEIMTETGLSFTSFEFKNSQGNKLENLQPTTQNYLSFGYRQNVLKDIIHVIGGLSFSKYGAIGSEDAINLFYKWETSYLAINLGLDIKAVQFKKLAFYLRGTISPEFLLQGTQTINNQVFDLKEADEFDNTNTFFRGGFLLEYNITDTFSIFGKYNFGKSTTNGTDQELKFKTNDVGIGLVFSLMPNKNNENQTTN